MKNNILSDVKEIDDVTAKIRKGGDKIETGEYPRINQDSWIVYTDHKVEQNQSKNYFSTIDYTSSLWCRFLKYISEIYLLPLEPLFNCTTTSTT